MNKKLNFKKVGIGSALLLGSSLLMNCQKEEITSVEQSVLTTEKRTLNKVTPIITTFAGSPTRYISEWRSTQFVNRVFRL